MSEQTQEEKNLADAKDAAKELGDYASKYIAEALKEDFNFSEGHIVVGCAFDKENNSMSVVAHARDVNLYFAIEPSQDKTQINITVLGVNDKDRLEAAKMIIDVGKKSPPIMTGTIPSGWTPPTGSLPN